MRAVLALGGNALQRSSDDGSVEGELQRAHASLAPMAELLERFHQYRAVPLLTTLSPKQL